MDLNTKLTVEVFKELGAKKDSNGDYFLSANPEYDSRLYLLDGFIQLTKGDYCPLINYTHVNTVGLLVDLYRCHTGIELLKQYIFVSLIKYIGEDGKQYKDIVEYCDDTIIISDVRNRIKFHEDKGEKIMSCDLKIKDDFEEMYEECKNKNNPKNN